ncbi:tRNA (uridine(34)/cytosine(34)/5-carboxymethylaminomethyluridine(34)-2'-O)-methyltransferase TrmL [Clostridia bacterium]|nr:tRNA (uridine(34)/cytosine(34)/5-carboxymethylaminomethyluridine(34)-2'-O)-methyltransferase TrmL [Clostridia bacterium]
MNIVLLEPEIPANTGNIGRTCVACGAALHLIKPLGFSLSDKYVRRSGLDYWDKLTYFVYEDYTDFLRKNDDPVVYMASTKARKLYSEVRYPKNAYILFGKESAGIPEEILVKNRDYAVRIPMQNEIRSLNLSNSVAVLLYEAMRQHNFGSLNTKGELHRLRWDS